MEKLEYCAWYSLCMCHSGVHAAAFEFLCFAQMVFASRAQSCVAWQQPSWVLTCKYWTLEVAKQREHRADQASPEVTFGLTSCNVTLFMSCFHRIEISGRVFYQIEEMLVLVLFTASEIMLLLNNMSQSLEFSFLWKGEMSCCYFWSAVRFFIISDTQHISQLSFICV